MGRHKNKNGAFVPVGLQIRHDIINRIYQNPNVSVKLPSARELAARFHLSQATVTQELQKLVKEGHLIGKHGSGTYTNPDKSKFIRSVISRRIVGILVGDGKLLIYDPVDRAVQAWSGMAFSPELAHPRPITLNSNAPEGFYDELLVQNLSGFEPAEAVVREAVRLGQKGIDWTSAAFRNDSPELLRRISPWSRFIKPSTSSCICISRILRTKSRPPPVSGGTSTGVATGRP